MYMYALCENCLKLRRIALIILSCIFASEDDARSRFAPSFYSFPAAARTERTLLDCFVRTKTSSKYLLTCPLWREPKPEQRLHCPYFYSMASRLEKYRGHGGKKNKNASVFKGSDMLGMSLCVL